MTFIDGISRQDALWGGVVMHSPVEEPVIGALSRSWYSSCSYGAFDGFGSRFSSFVTLVFGDLVLFMGIVIGIILLHRPRRYCCVKVDGHAFFRRERISKSASCRKALIFLYLIASPNLIHCAQQNLDSSFHVDIDGGDEEVSLMARQEISWRPPSLPSPNGRSDVEGDGGSASDDGRASRRGNSDDVFYQIAFIFTIEPDTVTQRLNWEDYWLLHGQVAQAIGVDIHRLVAIMNVLQLPQDLVELESHAIIAVRDADVRPGGGIVYTLIDIEMHDNQNSREVSTRRFAGIIPSTRTRSQILDSLHVADFCRRVQDRCLLWINNQRWQQQDSGVRQINNGDYIRCALPPLREGECNVAPRSDHELLEDVFGADAIREVSEQGDDVALMQFGPALLESSHTPSSVETKVINIYAWGQDYIEVPLEERLSMVESISSNWGIDAEDIVDLHEVLEPPMFLQVPGELVFVMEMKGDAHKRLFEDDKLILSEVRMVNIATRTSKSNRVVLWSRRLMQRFNAMGLLRMDSFCARSSTKECVLLHNNRVWTKDDRSSHRMDHGDFLLIEAYVDDISLNEAWDELKRQEEHECSRRMYTSPADLHQAVDPEAEDCTFSGSAAIDQEGGAPGSEEVSPWDSSPLGHADTMEEDDGDSEGVGLMQLWSGRLKAEGNNPINETQWDKFSELSPPGNPSERNVLPAPSSCMPERSSVKDGQSSHKSEDVSFDISDDEVEPEEVCAGGFARRIIPGQHDWDFIKLFQHWDDSPLRLQLPDDLEITPLALQFVAESFAGWSSDIEELHIYSDGSFDPREAVSTFAFAIFGWCGSRIEGKSFFVGWKAGVVCTDVEAPQYVGAKSHSVSSAEASALVWAHIWHLQSGLTCKVFYHYDSMVVGHGAAGFWQVSGDNAQLRKLRGIVHLGDSLNNGEKVYEHVKSHSGNPGKRAG